MFKDFFLKETEWGFPFEKKATKAQQWYTCLLVFVGFYAISTWISNALVPLWEGTEDKKYSKIMEEEETE